MLMMLTTTLPSLSSPSEGAGPAMAFLMDCSAQGWEGKGEGVRPRMGGQIRKNDSALTSSSTLNMACCSSGSISVTASAVTPTNSTSAWKVTVTVSSWTAPAQSLAMASFRGELDNAPPSQGAISAASKYPVIST